jgi:hypothetical protein
MIDKQAREMKDKFGILYREIFQSLRDENGRPYDPQFYSLQQSSDGNVFLVPRNMTADEQQAKLNKKVKKASNFKKQTVNIQLFDSSIIMKSGMVPYIYAVKYLVFQ